MTLDQIASRPGDSDECGSDLSRRTFLQAGAAAGGGLLLSLRLPFATGDAEAADGFAPNAFIRIESDGQIVLTMPYVEMGQGTYTSIPMLIAEELEVDLTQVRLDHAPPNEKLYGNPLLGGIQATGNSNARRGSRCAKPGQSREPCWSRRRQNGGTSTPRPAARKAAKCVTNRRDERPNTAISPPTRHA